MRKLNVLDEHDMSLPFPANVKIMSRDKNFMELAPALGNTFMVLMLIVKYYHIPGNVGFDGGFYPVNKNIVIAVDMGVSVHTINKIVKQLLRCDILSREHRGYYKVNKDFLRVL